jgi:hypothetical protein
VVVREVASGEEVYRSKIHNGRVANIAFSPTKQGIVSDGKLG